MCIEQVSAIIGVQSGGPAVVIVVVAQSKRLGSLDS